MGIADYAKKAENIVESYKLKLQSARKVCLKGAGAGRRHKTTEKKKNANQKKKSKKVLWGCSARSWSKKNKTNIYKT